MLPMYWALLRDAGVKVVATVVHDMEVFVWFVSWAQGRVIHFGVLRVNHSARVTLKLSAQRYPR